MKFPTRKYDGKNQELRNTQKLFVRTIFFICDARSSVATTSSYMNMNSNKNSVEVQVSERIIKDLARANEGMSGWKIARKIPP